MTKSQSGSLTYDDLLAARYLNQRFPRLSAAILKAIEHIVQGRSRLNLLSTLIANGMLSRKVAREIHERTLVHNRHRALKLFIRLVRREEKIPADALRSALAQLGDKADAIALGQELARRELLSRERARSLRYTTKIAFDRDRARRVREFLQLSGREGLRRTTVASISVPTPEEEDADVSVELDESGGVTTEAILTQTLHGATDEALLEPPRFPIPDWVDMSDALTGQSIRGYRLLGVIGTGAMGKVYLCDSRERTGPIALKLLGREADDEARARFRREVVIHGLLPSHERIIEIYDAGHTDSGYHYLAMEFFDSTDLFKILEVEKRLDPERAVLILRDICAALDSAHEAHIVHRDLKPANILASNLDGRAKLADFGIALNLDLGGLDEFVYKSLDGTVTGTAEFVSPEQAIGAEIDCRSDLYSLGVVMYLLLSGALPFECESKMGYLTSHMMEDPKPLKEACKGFRIPSKLLEINARLLEKNPADRFQSAKELDAALAEVRFDPSEESRRGGLWNVLGFGGR